MIQYCEAAAARKDGAHTSESDALCANLFFFVFARLIYLDWFYLRFLSSKLVTQMTQVADGTVARGLGRSVCQAAWQVCLPSIPACLLLPRSRMAHVTSFPGQMSLEGSPVHNLAMAMTWPRYAMVCNGMA